MQGPDAHPCWQGAWTPADAPASLWAHSAVLRTVGALPRLHPWRLGDVKGSRRTLVWCGVPEGADSGEVAVLSQYAPEPHLAVDDSDGGGPFDLDTLGMGLGEPGGLLVDLAVGLSREVADAVADRIADAASAAASAATAARGRPTGPDTLPSGVRRWVGGLARLPGSWLPPLAILPTKGRGADDPTTRWGTESLAFADRHTVHADDTRFASDVLAPHLTALVLDRVPEYAAVTIAGDALHVWWEYEPRTQLTPGRVAATVRTATLLRDAIPSFVLADHPDHSHEVEDRLAVRAREAAEYRASRDAGRHRDPTLQRIYDQAQADWHSRQHER